MKYIPAIGATCLGAVVGWLVRYFIRRFSTFGPMVLGSVLSIILGGAVIRFLEADRTVWWFYPIGLFVGFAIYQIIVMLDGGGSGGGGGGRGRGGAKTGVGLPSGWGKSNPKYIGRR